MINKIRSITIAVALLLAVPYSTANAVTSNAMALSINSFSLNSFTLRFSDSVLWKVLIGQPQEPQASKHE